MSISGANKVPRRQKTGRSSKSGHSRRISPSVPARAVLKNQTTPVRANGADYYRICIHDSY